jgi:hypothetical protein
MFFRKTLLIALALSLAGALTYAQSCGNCKMGEGKDGCKMAGIGSAGGTADSSKPGPAYVKMPGFDKKFQVEGYTVSYRFVKRPQIGTIILRVQVFNADKKQVKPFLVSGEYGMPSMKGAHDSGLQPFKTNVKGDYLLPVSLVMRGEWEVKMVISDKEKKPVYCGVFKFSI